MLKLRKPTGKAQWPILLLAGSEKSGKSYAAATASGDARIARTFWLSIGEKDPDEYGAVPGARFDIIEHDGTYGQIVQAVTDAAIQAREDAAKGETDLLVIDSVSRLWDLIVNGLTDQAAKRAKHGREPVITMDLWKRGKDWWNQVITQAVQAFNGPVILTARLDSVSVVEHGQPTGEKVGKIRGEKNLAFEVDGVIELPRRGEATLKGVRSVKAQLPNEIPLKDFTISHVWDMLGVEHATGERTFANTATDGIDREPES